MAERDRLIYRYGSERVEKCEKAWEFLMEAMQGQPFFSRECMQSVQQREPGRL